MTETTGIRSRTVTANGLRMHVTDAGTGSPVLMLHGFPQSAREWRRVMAALSDRAHLIAPDLRGAGETDAPSSGYDSPTVMRDLVALLDELGLEQVDLVGHDWGALVGFDLCLAHPDRVRRYVAIAVPAPYFRMSRALAAGLMRAMPHLWFQWVIATPGLGPMALSRGGSDSPTGCCAASRSDRWTPTTLRRTSRHCGTLVAHGRHPSSTAVSSCRAS
nr:hypothetical protein GCM10025699_36260 [Microbacterium flavescens]